MNKIESLSSILAIPTVELIDDAYALYQEKTLELVYCNPVFIEWFNIQQPGSLLDETIVSLQKETLFKRLDKRGYYNISIDPGSENKNIPALIEIKFQRTQWQGINYLSASARDMSILKENEMFIDSHSKMIEESNRKLSKKTSKLEESNQQLESLSKKLAKYLSPEVYNSIFTGEKEVNLETQRKKLTVFFSDIHGFTALTDTMEAESLATLLNSYLKEMAEVAARYGGTLDKFIGDAIMIFFGDPKSRGEKQDALACVMMAIEMRERLKYLREKWINQGISEPLHIRIGINTGYCTVGNFGSENRMDYTIIGGQVNLANRLEAQADTDQILVSHETFALVQDCIICESKGEISVKGVAHQVKTYQVIGINHEAEILNTTESMWVDKYDGFSMQVDLKRIDKLRVIESLHRTIQQIQGYTGIVDTAPKQD
ncbi:MAG: adenylate/guanylate cyclase domain-containing protein [Gammaproteobacteria bacterium]|jgi:class 3 adenylate cyclase|nr:adenylate/guanylate cyclase domain-containing protein [Gammaproteobacteria bacterium]MBT5222546.1 adenylate/guanylate cyclase domain-containing protein [Gammaproteobacteria bacterium]MBT5825308.1 adenylate/guanylate cyclase domain-containing protein [Gammaproteobacteria bacterium]MBT6420925.1 adenylate/guanylate cyclase domain-containing protein [Gammaproteobacteria bacterium]MBT6576747.1 adenylate/guanylate cyclase domain-containing protein [Gammaproteobacteria bacterium]